MTTPFVVLNSGGKKKKKKEEKIPSFMPAAKGSARTPLGPKTLEQRTFSLKYSPPILLY
jgi:hypothetical protein